MSFKDSFIFLWESTSIRQWLWFGLGLRFLVMPFACYPDLFHVFGHTYPLFGESVFDVYLFFANKNPGYTDLGVYEPLHYWLFGLWSGVTGVLMGEQYGVWIKGFLDLFPDTIYLVPEKIFALPGNEIKFKMLFVWKIFLMMFDLLVLVFGLKMISGDKARVAYISFWAGSPVLLYAIYMYGQADVAGLALVFIGLYLYFRKYHLKWVGLCFALSVPFKFFPIILLPLPFLLARHWRERTEILVFSALPLLAIYIPYYIHSEGLVFYRFQAGLTGNLLIGSTWKWVASVQQTFTVLGYLAVCYHACFMSNKEPRDLLRYTFIVFLLFLSLPSKIHTYVLLVPLWYFFILERAVYARILVSVMVLLFFCNLHEKASSMGIFMPLEPDFFMSFPGWMDITWFFFPSGVHVKLARLILFCLSICVVLDQFSILFRKQALFMRAADSQKVKARRWSALVAYPLAFVCGIVGILWVSVTPIQNYLKPYLFTRGMNHAGQPVINQLDWQPGHSVLQKFSMLKNRVWEIRYLQKEAAEGPFKVEILVLRDGVLIVVFERDFERFESGWVTFKPSTPVEADGFVYLRMSNLSSRTHRLELRRLGRGLDDRFYEGGNEEANTILAEAALPALLIEEPLMFHNPETTFRSIRKSVDQEKGFLIFWLILVSTCFGASLRYYLRQR